MFVSYSTRDRGAIQPILNSLACILDVRVSEDINRAGEPLPPKVTSDIKSSNVILVFLTPNSATSQWVNQELGYAVSHREREGGEPLIIPVVEEGFQPSGFVTKKDEECIAFFYKNPDETTYRLISRLREYINRNYTVVDNIKVACPKCDNQYEIALPSQQAIDDAVRVSRVIPAICDRCTTSNELDPRTFRIVRTSPWADVKRVDTAF